MNFFKKIVASIYSPSFYAGIKQQSLSSAIGYFTLFTLLIAVIQTSFIFFSADFTNLQSKIEKFVSQTINSYPDKLEVKINKGVVSTNVEEPYLVPFPGGPTEGRDNLIVINTKMPFSATEFRKYKTMMLLTKDSMFIASDNQLRAIDLSQVEDFTINKKAVESFSREISPWFKMITPFLTIFLFIALYVISLTRLIYLFFLALLILLLVKILKKPLTYGQAYQTGIYAMTLPFILDLLALLFKIQLIPFFFTLVSLAVVLINILPAGKTAATKKTPKATKKR